MRMISKSNRKKVKRSRTTLFTNKLRIKTSRLLTKTARKYILESSIALGALNRTSSTPKSKK